MAEIIGLAASIVTLVGLGAELSDTLRKVAHIVASARYEATLIASDISAFSNSLTQLSTILAIQSPETEKLREIAVVLTQVCKALMDGLSKDIGGCADSFNIFDKWFLLRFKWLFHRPKVALIRSLLESFKSTLILLVSSMILVDGRCKNMPAHLQINLEKQVKSNMRYSKDAAVELVSCGEHFEDFPETPSPETSTAAKHSLEEGMGNNDTRLTRPGLQVAHNDPLDDEHHAVVTITDSSGDSRVLHDRISGNIVYDLGSKVKHDVVQYKESSRILQVQEMVYEFAEKILTCSFPQTNWSWASPQPTVVETHAHANTRIQSAGSHSPSETPSRSYRSDLTLGSTSTVEPSSTEPPGGNTSPSRLSQVEEADALHLPSVTPSRAHEPEMSSAFAVDHGEKESRAANSSTDSNFNERLEDLSTNVRTSLGHDRQSQDPSSRQLENGSRVPPPPPPPQNNDTGDTLARLEKLLLGQYEDNKFSKLEQLLTEQEELRLKKEQEKKAAAEEAARKATEAKQRADQDKLDKIEKLILAQKDEQLKREAVAEAARKAEKAEAESKAAKEAAEKRAAAEAAAKLLEAAKAAREEAEAKAAKEAEEVALAHREALAQAEKETQELKEQFRIRGKQSSSFKHLPGVRLPNLRRSGSEKAKPISGETREQE